VRYPLSFHAELIAHDSSHTVRGGQFRGGYDLGAPGAQVISPVKGKIPHVRGCTTRCVADGLIPLDVVQFTLDEEQIVNGDRHVTGTRFLLARVLPVDGLDKMRRVEEGQQLGFLIDFLHIASNHDDRLRAMLGLT
jgi:hypothetical protein